MVAVVSLSHTQRTIIYRPTISVTVTINADGIIAWMVRFFYLLGLGRLRVWTVWRLRWVAAAWSVVYLYCCIVATQQYNREKAGFYWLWYWFGIG